VAGRRPRQREFLALLRPDGFVPVGATSAAGLRGPASAGVIGRRWGPGGVPGGAERREALLELCPSGAGMCSRGAARGVPFAVRGCTPSPSRLLVFAAQGAFTASRILLLFLVRVLCFIGGFPPSPSSIRFVASMASRTLCGPADSGLKAGPSLGSSTGLAPR